MLQGVNEQTAELQPTYVPKRLPGSVESWLTHEGFSRTGGPFLGERRILVCWGLRWGHLSCFIEAPSD